MSLKTTIQEDMKAAMRAKDAPTLSTIRLLLSEIKQIEVDERVELDDARIMVELDDARIMAVLSKMIKQRRDSVNIYSQAGRSDLAEKESAEIGVLQRYLPAALDEAAIRKAVEEAVAETGAAGMADMGKVMALLKTRLTGQADMGEVSKILKSVLGA